MGFLKCPRSSWASELDAHPLVFLCWAFIALVHPLHGNPYSSCWHQLMGISIARWLASSMWDFLLFCLLHTIPIIIFYSTHSAISMARSYIAWKFIGLRLLKYETIAWLVIGVVHDESILVWRKWSMTKLYDFVGINFLWPCYFEKTWLLWLVCLKYYYFYVNMNFCHKSFGSEYSYHN